ncbi:hypothetical protein IAD21_04237 [Abditibacteriota bacterium]|nr:hypothetical protein IAD21_04237 [Abditibacteriota bacterium]
MKKHQPWRCFTTGADDLIWLWFMADLHRLHDMRGAIF